MKKKYLDIGNPPLHDRAAHAIEDYIQDNHLTPGDRLPTEDQLASLLKVSRTTIRAALGQLEYRGKVDRRHGSGTYVNALLSGHLRRGLETVDSLRNLAHKAGVQKRTAWKVHLTPAGERIAKLLLISPGEEVINVQTRAEIDGRAYAFLNSHVPTKNADLREVKTLKDGTLLDYLYQRGEHELSHTNTNIYSIPADIWIAEQLNVNVGESVLHLDEVFFTRLGEPIFSSANYFLTSHVNFNILRRVSDRPFTD